MFQPVNTLLFITLTATTCLTQAAEVMRIHDRGLDGMDRIFVVNCPNGNRTSVTVTYEMEPQVKVANVCVFPASGEKTCRNQWDVDQAALFSCQ